MELNQVYVIGLETLQRLIDLARSRFFGAPVELSHQKDLIAITIAQRRAHASFAFA